MQSDSGIVGDIIGIVSYVIMRNSIIEYLRGSIAACLPGDGGAGLGDTGDGDRRQRARFLLSGVNGAGQ